MITKNIKDLKKASYILLMLLSTAEARATTFLPKEYCDQPVVGGSIKVPYKEESFIDTLEKRIKLLFEDYATQEDDVQKDIQSPAMDVDKERYTRNKNKVIDKHGKDRPELARFRTSSSKQNGKPTLAKEARDFADSAEQIKEKLKKKNEDLQKNIEIGINGGSSLLEAVIDNKTEGPAKKVLLDLVGKAKEEILNFFK